MAIADPVVMPLAEALLDCLAQEIAKVDSPPAYIGLRPGIVVDHLISLTSDECCEGLAWVRPAGFYPSSAALFDQDGAPVKGGTRGWAVQLEMGVVRCAPTSDQNSIPTNEAWAESVQAILDDGAAMRRALCCFEAPEGQPKRLILPGQWEPISIQGGCAGGILTVTVRGPACDCADAGPAPS